MMQHCHPVILCESSWVELTTLCNTAKLQENIEVGIIVLQSLGRCMRASEEDDKNRDEAENGGGNIPHMSRGSDI